MAISKDLFSLNNFQSTISNYCRQANWSIRDINSERAIIAFDMESGSTQNVFIIRHDTTVEFSCPSGIKFDELDEIYHKISSYLLIENSKYKLGFWCIEKINNREVYSIMHNSEINLIDANHFVRVIHHLIKKCDDFEREAGKALGP